MALIYLKKITHSYLTYTREITANKLDYHKPSGIAKLNKVFFIPAQQVRSLRLFKVFEVFKTLKSPQVGQSPANFGSNFPISIEYPTGKSDKRQLYDNFAYHIITNLNSDFSGSISNPANNLDLILKRAELANLPQPFPFIPPKTPEIEIPEKI